MIRAACVARHLWLAGQTRWLCQAVPESSGVAERLHKTAVSFGLNDAAIWRFLVYEAQKEKDAEMEMKLLEQDMKHTAFVCALKGKFAVFCKRHYLEKLLLEFNDVLVHTGELKAGQELDRNQLNRRLRRKWQEVREVLGLPHVELPDFPTEVLYGSLSQYVHGVPPLYCIFTLSDEPERFRQFWQALASKYDVRYENVDSDMAALGLHMMATKQADESPRQSPCQSPHQSPHQSPRQSPDESPDRKGT